jgi:hypothetical protein
MAAMAATPIFRIVIMAEKARFASAPHSQPAPASPAFRADERLLKRVPMSSQAEAPLRVEKRRPTGGLSRVPPLGATSAGAERLTLQEQSRAIAPAMSATMRFSHAEQRKPNAGPQHGVVRSPAPRDPPPHSEARASLTTSVRVMVVAAVTLSASRGACDLSVSAAVARLGT